MISCGKLYFQKMVAMKSPFPNALSSVVLPLTNPEMESNSPHLESNYFLLSVLVLVTHLSPTPYSNRMTLRFPRLAQQRPCSLYLLPLDRSLLDAPSLDTPSQNNPDIKL